MSALILTGWDGGATEDELVAALDCTYLEIREALAKCNRDIPKTIPTGLKQEIYDESLQCADERYDDVNWISSAYGIAYNIAYYYRINPPKAEEYTRRIIEFHKANPKATRKEIQARLNMSGYKVNRALGRSRAHNYLEHSEKEIVRDRLINGELQQDLAKEYGVSQSTISKLNPNRSTRVRRDPLSDERWAQLKDSLKTLNVSEVSRQYNISRAYIYKRLNNENN